MASHKCSVFLADATQKQAIKELILDRNGILHDEPSRLLIDDMQSMVQANSLLALIANGCHKLSEISARIQVPSTSLTRPLSQLIELGYVKRELPFGENIKSTKRTLYKLNDPFLLFWYKFVEPNRSLLERDLVNEVYKEVEKALPLHISGVWEEIARESTAYLTIGGIAWKPASRWWGNGIDGKPMEIDLIAESFDKKSILIGEVNWAEKSNVKDILNKLDYYVQNFQRTNNCRVIKALWLKNKITNDTDEVHMVSPQALFLPR